MTGAPQQDWHAQHKPGFGVQVIAQAGQHGCKRAGVVVFGIEVGGRWAPEAASLVRLLASARALRPGLSGILAVAAQRALAASLLHLPFANECSGGRQNPLCQRAVPCQPCGVNNAVAVGRTCTGTAGFETAAKKNPGAVPVQHTTGTNQNPRPTKTPTSQEQNEAHRMREVSGDVSNELARRHSREEPRSQQQESQKQPSCGQHLNIYIRRLHETSCRKKAAEARIRQSPKPSSKDRCAWQMPATKSQGHVWTNWYCPSHALQR